MRSKIVIQGKDCYGYPIIYKKGCPIKYSFMDKSHCWIFYLYGGNNRVYFSSIYDRKYRVYFSSRSKEPCGFRSILLDGSELITIMLRGWSK